MIQLVRSLRFPELAVRSRLYELVDNVPSEIKVLTG